MSRARVRLELPPDFPVSDEDVRAALQHGLDDLIKGHTHDKLRKLPHRHVQSLIDRSRVIYEKQMALMLEEIQAALLS